MSSLLVILIGTVLVNTFLLMQDDEALGGDRKTGSTAYAIRIAGATLATLMLAVVLTLVLWWLSPSAPSDALLLAYGCSVAAIAIGLHRVTRRRFPRLRRSLASSPILIVGNCLALGAVLLGIMTSDQAIKAILYAFTLGIGFAVVLVLFVALTSRISEREVPAAFRFAPITFISAGLTALALMGFTGLLRG